MPGGGEAGVIEIHREPTKIPYRISRDIGRVQAGHIFVRHGSQTETADRGRAAGARRRGPAGERSRIADARQG